MNQIFMAQIDPNGLCNSECWFCPVAYSPNPAFAKKNMPIEIIQYQKFISVELMLMEKLKNYLQVNGIKEKQFYY